MQGAPLFRMLQEVNGEQFGWLDLVRMNATVELAIGFSRLFWPSYVEFGGGVFIADDFVAATFNDWLEHCGGDLNAVERAMNHRLLGTLFQKIEEVSAANCHYLGEALVEMWKCRLAQQFPGRAFTVVTWWDAEKRDQCLTFCQTPQGAQDLSGNR
jgi:hypothetical protein